MQSYKVITAEGEEYPVLASCEAEAVEKARDTYASASAPEAAPLVVQETEIGRLSQQVAVARSKVGSPEKASQLLMAFAESTRQQNIDLMAEVSEDVVEASPEDESYSVGVVVTFAAGAEDTARDILSAYHYYAAQ